MTSFAFIAGLIPLILAAGPGAIGNRTIGASALGGMLFGTVFGIIIIPGLYYIFASIAGSSSLIKGNEQTPHTTTHETQQPHEQQPSDL
jgi:hydrophobic/amphiphilic exporter-1 (mainly G- bacteria), HAE1 family